MSIRGVGAVTATSFVAAIEDPANFRTSRSVGAWIGLTTRRYQSRAVDYDGDISRPGDPHLRWLRYEAASGPKAVCGHGGSGSGKGSASSTLPSPWPANWR